MVWLAATVIAGGLFSFSGPEDLVMVVDALMTTHHT